MPRTPLDQYETPPHYVEPLIALTGPMAGLSVYEPCVGRGHIATFLSDAAVLCTNDLDLSCPADWHEDARTSRAWPSDPTDVFDWTITNPPFSDGLQILQCALTWSKNVAVLARLSFLEPTQGRGAFWCQYPPTDVIVLPRYSFRLNDAGKKQSDNVTCCWVIYRDGRPPCLNFSLKRR